MNRALLTLGGTAAGIAALLAVKFQPASSTLAGAGTLSVGTVPASATSAAAPSGAAGVAGTGTKAPTAGAKPSATTRPTATSAPKASSGGGAGQSTGTRVVTGAVASTNYGPMQVQITVTGGKITKVNVVQQTNVGSYSGQVDSMAIPKLTSETLSAQSAKIDAVSGASYTSAGYIQSLQSALDQAGL